MKLKNQFAVITGASRGYGKRIAQAFVSEGASVAICARSTDALSRVADELRTHAGAGQQVISTPCDISDESSVDSFFEEVRHAFSRIDVLVNCAGVAGPIGPVQDVHWKEWKESIAINVFGTVYPTTKVLPGMLDAGWGKIINISGGGATKPLPNISSYAAAKSAIVRFTETLAVELRDTKIDVNAVAPGVLGTAMVNDFVKAGEENVGAKYIDEVARLQAGKGDEFTQAVALCVFLASHASDGISGKLISAVWDPWKDLPKHVDAIQQSDVFTLRRIIPEERELDLS